MGEGPVQRGSDGLRAITRSLGIPGRGGVSFLTFSGRSIVGVGIAQLLPAGLPVASLILVNTATVSGVVAIVQQRSVIEIWKATTLPTAPFIALTAFLAFYLGWLYSGLGPGGTARPRDSAVGY